MYRLIMLLALCLLLSSCGLIKFSRLQRELNQQRSFWEGQALESYRYTYRWHCFCPPELTDAVSIVVKDGAIATLTYLDSGTLVNPEVADQFYTIDGLFDFLQNAINRRAADLSVSWDNGLGYPKTAAIDYLLHAVDDETSFTVSDFQ